MKSGCLVRIFLGGVAFLAAEPASQAQMQIQARFKGEMLPVVDCNEEYLFVLKDGHKKSTGYGDYDLQPAASFGSGFIDIQNVQVDLDPLRNASASQRADPDSINFRYEADLSSDRDLKHCYVLLTFVAKASVGTWFVHIGRMPRGARKHVKITFRDRIDAVGSLHVFSEASELHSTQIQKPYDVREYHASLLRGFRGLSALELLESERAYPHVLSDDGRLLATIRDRDTHFSLIAYDLESMKLLCDVSVGNYDDHVSGLTWVSDHELAFVKDETLNLLDVHTRQYESIQDDVLDIVTAVKRQSGVLILVKASRRFGVWTAKFDLRTRRTIGWEDLESGATMFDDFGEPRVHCRDDGDKREYDFKPKRDSTWKRLDSCVKEKGLKFDTRAREELDRVVDIHSIGPDGDTLYISSRLNSDVFQLTAFSMSSGVIKQTIASHPQYDLTSADDGITRLLFRKATSEVIGMVFEAKRPEVIWLDAGFKAVQHAVDKTLAGHVNLPVDWSEDGSTFIYFSFSDQDPGTYYVFRPLQSVLMPLLVLGDRFHGKKMAKTAPIEFTARDGAKIHAYVTYPPDPITEPAPLVVVVHGGPMVRDSWHFDATNQFLATRGYVVLQVNYRGSSGYGALYQRVGLRSRLDQVIIDDIADGVRHLLSQGNVDPARIAVMGGSFGGWATYLSLIRYPELYRAGVAISAISHWRKLLKDARWEFGAKFSYAYWKSLLDRQGFKTDEPFIDPYLRAKEIRQPLYIMHGAWDRRIDVEEAHMMVKALRKHNPQVEKLIFPQTGHTAAEWSLYAKVRCLNEIGSFLDRHLKGDRSAAPAASGMTPPHAP